MTQKREYKVYYECESDRLKIWQRLAEQSGKKISEIKGEK